MMPNGAALIVSAALLAIGLAVGGYFAGRSGGDRYWFSTAGTAASALWRGDRITGEVSLCQMRWSGDARLGTERSEAPQCKP